MTDFSERYGPWAVVAGGSDGIGASFAHALARRGLNLVLLARRAEVLDAFAAEVRAAHGVEVRTVVADLTAPQAIAELAAATAGLEIGLFIANAGGDDISMPFLDKDLDKHLALVQRNCLSVIEAAYRFGGPMVSRGRGGVILATSGAAWAGGVHLAAYGATKAFDLILAEALWAEWRDLGVDVLALVITATDTPSMHRALEPTGGYRGALADPDDVARAALDHLGDGPTWMCGTETPLGPPPFGTLTRREAVLRMSRRSLRGRGVVRRRVEHRMGQQVDGGVTEPLEHGRVGQRQAEHLLDERAEDDVREVDRPVQHQPDVGIGQRPGDLRLDQRLHLAAHQLERLGEQRQAGCAALQGDPPDVAGDQRVVGDELVERLTAGAGGDRRRLIEPDAADHLADLGHHRVLDRLRQLVLGLEVVHHGTRGQAGFLGDHPDRGGLQAVLRIQAQRRLADARPGGEVGRTEGQARVRHDALNSRGPTSETTVLETILAY